MRPQLYVVRDPEPRDLISVVLQHREQRRQRRVRRLVSAAYFSVGMAVGAWAVVLVTL